MLVFVLLLVFYVNVCVIVISVSVQQSEKVWRNNLVGLLRMQDRTKYDLDLASIT